MSAKLASGMVAISAFVALTCTSPGLRLSALNSAICSRRYPAGCPARVGIPFSTSPLPSLPWQTTHGSDALRPRSTAAGSAVILVGCIFWAAK